MQTRAQQEGGLLESIAEFCRISGMAESTFGRHAVNDGKFVARLRDGARITPETLDRVSRYMALRGVAAPEAPREVLQAHGGPVVLRRVLCRFSKAGLTP